MEGSEEPLRRSDRFQRSNADTVAAMSSASGAGMLLFRQSEARSAPSTTPSPRSTCHAAHGSDQPRMMRQPYEPPHFQLCSQCHSVPPKHNLNSFHGDRWAGLPCSNCHVDIHGSYTSRWFLGKELEAEGCTRPSCHSS